MDLAIKKDDLTDWKTITLKDFFPSSSLKIEQNRRVFF